MRGGNRIRGGEKKQAVCGRKKRGRSRKDGKRNGEWMKETKVDGAGVSPAVT